MAGYTYNFRNNPPEYSNVPSADSVNGTNGSYTPAAQQNQRNIAGQSRTGTSDAYQAFRDAQLGWPTPQTAAQPTMNPLAATLTGQRGAPANTAAPSMSASALSGILTGKPSAQSMPEVDVQPVYGNQGYTASAQSTPMAQPPVPPAYGPPAIIPPVPTMPGTAPIPANPGGYGPPMPPTSSTPSSPREGATPVPSTPVYDPATGLWAWSQSGTMAPGTAPVASAPVTSPGPQQPIGELPPSRGTTGPAPTPVPSPTSAPTWDSTTGQWLYAKSYSNGEGPNGPGGGPENRLPDGGDPNAPPPNTPPPNTPPPNTPPPNTAPPGGGRHRPADPVTSHNDWLHSDSTGKPWGHDNMPPKPPGTEDPAIAARWYQQFNFLDPSLVNVTAADVQAFRTSGYNPTEQELSTQPGMLRNAFLAWWQHGKPTPAQNPPSPTPGPSVPTANPNPVGLVPDPRRMDPNDPNYMRTVNAWNAAHPDQKFTPQTAPATPPQPPPGTGGTPTTPPPATPPPATPPPDAGGGTSTPKIDLAQTMRDLYNPLFRQQQNELARTLRAQAAATDPNLPSSGGFLETLGRQEGTLVNAQGAQLGGYINQAQDRALQLTLAEIDDATKRLSIQTNDDLQRWLNSADSNTLQRYGIDKNDLLQRYQAELQLKGVQYSADRGVDAAALHAAATQAAAAAQSAVGAAEVQARLQMFGQQNTLDWAQLQAQLYMNGQQNYVTELGYLINSGLSANDAMGILGIFNGGNFSPVFVH